ncbi:MULTISPECIES: DUF262 domain-containing protein [unclassified Cryobacterium]|uniref:DUF262 domain-containing protein n=1 Tax=unclassified Cryobacterium TaxID=2649013 RepID=UPI0018E06D8B|nr:MULTISPECIES: DUF262 domain-containing protein [unclassified Cryobacterium]
MTIEDVLSRIHQKQYLLPAIQREFVWKQDQVLALVDSLMRKYPIGSFLLWDVNALSAQDYVFYDFITDYHEQRAPFATKAAVPASHGVTAVLDGQQRLTALNIAVYGSHAEKKKRAWSSSPDAFPRKRVYLNLAESPDHEELGFEFDLRFLTDAEAVRGEDGVDRWFALRDALDLADAGPAIIAVLARRNVPVDGGFERLYRLYEALRVTKPINWYLESSQDSNKVLDIFVRVNSGGTTLSYSDLLLSMATNQWETRDAREDVRELVQEVNLGGSRDFNFSRDAILKTALMISGLSVAFRVSNFTRKNMATVEAEWPIIQTATLNAAILLRQFGYSARTISADSVMIVLAYYLAKNSFGSHYLESTATARDRLLVRNWLARSLLKPGIWGSGLDTLLTRIRSAIDENPLGTFPVKEIEREMAAMGKSITFEQSDLDDVLDTKYGSGRAFAALSLLYPGLDFTKEFHQDHIYPKSRFTDRKLVDAGVSMELIDDYQSRFNLLPNLQLLSGVVNVEKLDSLPEDWVRRAFPSSDQRRTYLTDNDLDGLSLSLPDFVETYTVRRERMRERLLAVLGS